MGKEFGHILVVHQWVHMYLLVCSHWCHIIWGNACQLGDKLLDKMIHMYYHLVLGIQWVCMYLVTYSRSCHPLEGTESG